MSKKYKNRSFPLILFLLFSLGACKKFTEIPAPKNGVVTTEVFSSDATANSAVAGIYTTLSGSSLADGHTTLYLGMSADELVKYYPQDDDKQMMNNALLAANSNVLNIWTGPYQVIAQANACLEGLTASSQLSDSLKSQLLAESKFLRAFGNFYLVNLFGDIPLLTSTDWSAQSIISRTAKDSVYKQIIQDLTDALTGLPASYSSGHVIRATKWAATALLARVNLYQGQWAVAEANASAVITAFAGTPLPDPNSVFLIDSKEAIWQLEPLSYYQNTPEGSLFYSFGFLSSAITDTLYNAFETGDLRQADWLSSAVDGSGNTVYYPYKYKANTYQSPSTEYYMVLRLAEQYLVRAEARAEQNNIAGAVDDLNMIRSRAGLANLSAGMSQNNCLLAIEQERRVELFAEWGHRWLDLKRTGRANALLAPVKPQWTPDAILYPIPSKDIQLNSHLTQNPGYN